LRLWRSGKIKRCGVVKNDITYELHGTGCAVSLPRVHVDFDYGPGGRVDGFDVWRLFVYASELPQKYPKYQSKKFLETDFERYVTSGLFKPMPENESGLYCFSEHLKKQFEI
jgi:hypothetical protein